MKTRIYLLRHGETVNSRGVFKFNGHFDVDVTEEGSRQLSLQAQRLKNRPIRYVYSSDLKRAVKGAEIIASTLSAKAITDRRLREISAGNWEGLSASEVQEKYPEDFKSRYSDIVNFRIPGGENLLDVRKRSLAAISEILDRHKGEETAIVAHGGINRVILSDAIGLDLKNILRIEQEFGCLNIIDYLEGTSLVRLLNMSPSSFG